MSEGPALYELAAKAMIARSGRAFALKRHSHRGDLFWDLPGGRLAAATIWPRRFAASSVRRSATRAGCPRSAPPRISSSGTIPATRGRRS